ncbi:predicted protein [Postia placenta Mad-698-R]|nr:predicted protein [Postia placenta Mad-698-R]
MSFWGPRSSSCQRKSFFLSKNVCAYGEHRRHIYYARLTTSAELAVLVDDPHAHRTPSAGALKQWNADRAASAKLQIAAAQAKLATEKTSKQAMSEDALRKRKEREERRAAAARAKAIAEGLDPDTADMSASGSAATAADDRSVTPGANPGQTTAYTVTLPASSSELSWYDPTNCTYATIEDARATGVWTYPADLHERAKCGVFRDLWEKGNFMGGGIKFGGDFLVYPGDPLRYHSHFVATVHDSPVWTIKPMEIVAHGRLGTATKKAHLLCGWDDEKQQVAYFSIEWAGFG